MVREGQVALELASGEGAVITFQTIGAGEILGASWLVPPFRWTIDARALERTRAISLDAVCVRTKCEDNPELGWDLMSDSRRCWSSACRRPDCRCWTSMDARAEEDTAPPTVAAGPMIPQLFRVVDKSQETADSMTINVAPLDGRPAARFCPGQFNMLYLFGRGEVPISISSDPGLCGALAHTVRAVGNVTQGLVDLNCGDVIGVRGPFGSGWPMPTCEDRDLW